MTTSRAERGPTAATLARTISLSITGCRLGNGSITSVCFIPEHIFAVTRTTVCIITIPSKMTS
jgi:hypothetical protein